MLNSLQQMHLKLLHQKVAEPTRDLIGNTVAIKLQKSEDLHHKILQRQKAKQKRQNLTDKYQNKYIYQITENY